MASCRRRRRCFVCCHRVCCPACPTPPAAWLLHTPILTCPFAVKLENDTETFEHERVSSELKKQIQQARLAKKLTQVRERGWEWTGEGRGGSGRHPTLRAVGPGQQHPFGGSCRCNCTAACGNCTAACGG